MTNSTTTADDRRFLSDLDLGAIAVGKATKLKKSLANDIAVAIANNDVATIVAIAGSNRLSTLPGRLSDSLSWFCLKHDGDGLDIEHFLKAGLSFSANGIFDNMLKTPSAAAARAILRSPGLIPSIEGYSPHSSARIARLQTFLVEQVAGRREDGVLTQDQAAGLAEVITILSEGVTSARTDDRDAIIKCMVDLIGGQRPYAVMSFGDPLFRGCTKAILGNRNFSVHEWTTLWTGALRQISSVERMDGLREQVGIEQLKLLDELLVDNPGCRQGWIDANAMLNKDSIWTPGAEKDASTPLSSNAGVVRTMLVHMGFAGREIKRQEEWKTSVGGDYLGVLLAAGSPAVGALSSNPAGLAAIRERLTGQPGRLLSMIHAAPSGFSTRMIRQCGLLDWQDGYGNRIGHYIAAGIILRLRDDAKSGRRCVALMDVARDSWFSRNNGGVSADEVLNLAGKNQLGSEMRAMIDGLVINDAKNAGGRVGRVGPKI